MKPQRKNCSKQTKKLIYTGILLLFCLNASAQYYENSKSTRGRQESSETTKDEIIPINRNITAVGYQIGGFSLVGIDYEIRTNDYFGLHLGIGFMGATAGFKVHTSPRRDSPFFNFSLKDGGFGQLNTAGVEFGGRILFNKNNNSSIGLHAQFGVGAILNITEEMEEALYGTEPAPPVTLTMGIGLSW